MDITTYTNPTFRQPPVLLTLLMKRTTTRPPLPALTSISCYSILALVLKAPDSHGQLTQAKSMISNPTIKTPNRCPWDITSQSQIHHSILTPSHGTSNSSVEEVSNLLRTGLIPALGHERIIPLQSHSIGLATLPKWTAASPGNTPLTPPITPKALRPSRS